MTTGTLAQVTSRTHAHSPWRSAHHHPRCNFVRPRVVCLPSSWTAHTWSSPWGSACWAPRVPNSALADRRRAANGVGAGFYVDATEEKWKTNYNMYSYCTLELPELINENFSTKPDAVGITGHSMGGHGALICALKNPGMYKSVSAFAPICHPRCGYGRLVMILSSKSGIIFDPIGGARVCMQGDGEPKRHTPMQDTSHNALQWDCLPPPPP